MKQHRRIVTGIYVCEFPACGSVLTIKECRVAIAGRRSWSPASFASGFGNRVKPAGLPASLFRGYTKNGVQVPGLPNQAPRLNSVARSSYIMVAISRHERMKYLKMERFVPATGDILNLVYIRVGQRSPLRHVLVRVESLALRDKHLCSFCIKHRGAFE